MTGSSTEDCSHLWGKKKIIIWFFPVWF